MPAFVSTLCICIVFIPIFFLEGTAKYLFGPLAMAVIFAMLASYFLSRTVVPRSSTFSSVANRSCTTPVPVNPRPTAIFSGASTSGLTATSNVSALATPAVLRGA